jgi:hypothetical protein
MYPSARGVRVRSSTGHGTVRHRSIPADRRSGTVLSLAAYVSASVRTEEHEFENGFAFVLFLADSPTAAAFVPDIPF